MMKTKILSLLLLAVCCISAAAQTSHDAFERHQYVSSAGDTLHYRVLPPADIVEGRQYPLVLFMHGAGERGSDNEAQLIHGADMWLSPAVRSDFSAFVIFPQCPESGYWAYNSRPESFEPSLMPVLSEPTSNIAAVIELIEGLTALPSIDSDRVYVMGLSMGGMATYDLAIRRPDLFAAAVPICGTVNPSRLDAASDVPFRVYHGAIDNVVPVDGSRKAVERLRSLGAEVVYTEYPGVKHGSWHNAFRDPALLPWLFSHSRCDGK